MQTRRGRRVEAGGGSIEERGGADGGTVSIELGRRAADTGCGGTAATGAARVSPVRRMRHWTRAVRHRYGARLPAAMIRHCVPRPRPRRLRPANLLLELLRRVPEIHFTAHYSHANSKKIKRNILLTKYHGFIVVSFLSTHTCARGAHAEVRVSRVSWERFDPK